VGVFGKLGHEMAKEFAVKRSMEYGIVGKVITSASEL
jgi:hypothetical protein